MDMDECPFCKEKELMRVLVQEYKEGGAHYYVACRRCKATGPKVYVDEDSHEWVEPAKESKILWNRR